MSVPTLRDYQTNLLDSVRAEFAKHRRVLAVSPTGSGKTVTFAWLTQQVAQRGKRVTIVAHRTEIVEQISQALTSFGVQHGMIAQGRPRNGLPVQVAMVQTLARRLAHYAAPDLLVVDEAHHAVAGTWRTVASTWPQARVLGVTATPERLDGRGLGDAFDALVLGPTVTELIAAGHLAGFRHFSSPDAFDRGAAHIRAGDFDAGEVVAEMRRRAIVGNAVVEYRKRADGLPAVVFCPTVAFAEEVAGQFRAAGIAAAAVDGGMAPSDRANTLHALRAGALKVVTSCELISEGFDLPAVSAAILLRPTASLGLYLQQVGRALRPKPDGSQAIILDHVGNGMAHGLIDADRDWSLHSRKRKPEAPGVRQCLTCYRVVAAGDAASVIAGCGPTCGLIPQKSGGADRDIEQVDGELVELNAAAVPQPTWTRQDLRTAPLRELLRDARTREQVDAIRVARNYAPGWTFHIMRTRERRRQAAA